MIRIDGFAIDCALRETHRFEAEVTKYPIESGSKVADNVQPNPIAVTIEGIVSDNPMPGPIANERGDQGDGQPLAHKPSEDAAAFLQVVFDAREPVEINTSLQTYADMIMTSLEIPRDAETGHALSFTAEFEQAKFVTNNRATIKVAPPKQTGLGAKKDLGNKPTFDLNKGAIIWHHSEPAPLWSTSEVVGYSASDVRTKGTSGFYHLDGRVFTQEDLDDYNADQKLWYSTHDEQGNPVVNGLNAPTDALPDPDHLRELPKDSTFSSTNQQWQNAQGTPITYDPVWGKWMEE